MRCSNCSVRLDLFTPVTISGGGPLGASQHQFVMLQFCSSPVDHHPLDRHAGNGTFPFVKRASLTSTSWTSSKQRLLSTVSLLVEKSPFYANNFCPRL